MSSTVNVSCRNHSCSDVCRPAPPGLVKQLYICLCNESRDLSRDNRTCQRKKCSEQIRKSHQVKPLSSGDFVFSTHIINKSFHVSVFPTEDNWTLGLLFFLFTATNICQSWGICQQTCEKLPQGHKCGCHEGFHLEPDGFTCRPLGKCCQCWTNRYISHLSILVFQLYSI